MNRSGEEMNQGIIILKTHPREKIFNKARDIPGLDVERISNDDWRVRSQHPKKRMEQYDVTTDKTHRGALCTCRDAVMKLERGDPAPCKHLIRCDLAKLGALGYTDRRDDDEVSERQDYR